MFSYLAYNWHTTNIQRKFKVDRMACHMMIRRGCRRGTDGCCNSTTQWPQFAISPLNLYSILIPYGFSEWFEKSHTLSKSNSTWRWRMKPFLPQVIFSSYHINDSDCLHNAWLCRPFTMMCQKDRVLVWGGGCFHTTVCHSLWHTL